MSSAASTAHVAQAQAQRALSVRGGHGSASGKAAVACRKFDRRRAE